MFGKLSFLYTVKAFVKKEFAQIFRDKRMRIVLFVLPMVQMVVFAIAISTEVKNIKLGLQYAPDDHQFAMVADHLEKSTWFRPVPLKRGEDYMARLQRGELDGVLFAPIDHAGRDAERFGRGYQLLVDGTNILRAQSIERYVYTVLAGMNKNTNKPKVEFKIRTLYNPEFRSPYFLVPGTMAMIVGLVTVLLTSMSLSREKEMGTLEMILVSPVKSWEVILGKTVPFLILGLINATTIMFLAIVVFRIPMLGNYLLLFLSVFLFVFATVNVGTFISTFANNQQQAMLGGFIFLFTSNLLAGIMFPIDNMPDIIKMLVYLNPLKFFVELLRGIMLKDAPLEAIVRHLLILFSLGLGLAYLSYQRLRKVLA